MQGGVDMQDGTEKLVKKMWGGSTIIQ